MIKIIIFDIGGVTIKFPMYGVYLDVGKKFKIQPELVRKKFNELCPLIEINKIKTRKFWTLLSKKLKVKNIGLLKKVWLKSVKNSPLNKKVVKIIKALKARGYKVVALSNTILPHDKIYKELGYYKFFDKLFLSCRLKMRKPEKRIFLYCIRKLRVKPSECLFIDDKVDNIESAKKVGIKAILFKNAQQLKKDLKNYLS